MSQGAHEEPLVQAPGADGRADGRVLEFRRSAAAPRRKRKSLAAALLLPLAAALALTGVPLGAVAWVLTSPRFALRQVELAGNERIPRAWVDEALAPVLGTNLVRLPLADVAARLHRHPWLATVEIEKELPDGLRLAIVEREPVALLSRGGELLYADADGEAIAPVGLGGLGEEARGLLLVSFPERVPDGVARALEVAGELGRVEPDWAAHLGRIEVLGEEDFRLETGALPFPILVRSGDVAEKAKRLEALLPELARRYPAIESVDLRFSRRIVIEPAAPPPAAGTAGASATS